MKIKIGTMRKQILSRQSLWTLILITTGCIAGTLYVLQGADYKYGHVLDEFNDSDQTGFSSVVEEINLPEQTGRSVGRGVNEAENIVVPTIIQLSATDGTLKTDSNDLMANVIESEFSNELLQVTKEPVMTNVRLAIEDMMSTFGSQYPKGETYLKELDAQLKL
jgi:hypothetical protein